ncbi:5-oxoprolinase subunit PxpB [Seongchinamella sediminis]|uniref:5-oxoprolinase subunit PxpB n=1 Tax=Seongchinamella sediminis TaxID=2283635 RepID=A0A3L7E050_9GAMM|nr:5-oxoprolinase subunit PxpB [Seongchinamella sediminis]RLQ21631.1 5-oxoprolinase subunit PxpB [Seongchinamella sediminis]
MELHFAGENALMLYLGDETSPQVSARVQAAAVAVEATLGEDLVDLVPSYASLLVVYNPMTTDHLSVAQRIHHSLDTLESAAAAEGEEVVLPVYYHPEAGEDLEALAARASMSVDEVIALHSGCEYRVYAIGFAPGFAYLGQVDQRIAAPRLATPRQKVPRGAVAIADRQTAVYPAQSPGGWNLIGRCPLRMFDPNATPTMPVSVGDRVRFEPVDRSRFLALGGEL